MIRQCIPLFVSVSVSVSLSVSVSVSVSMSVCLRLCLCLCCSVLQRVAVCCSVLQCAVYPQSGANKEGQKDITLLLDLFEFEQFTAIRARMATHLQQTRSI